MQKSAREEIDIPQAIEPLTAEPHWVVWRWVRKADGKLTKPPYRADNPTCLARNNDPTTWSDFNAAMRTYVSGHADGIGFMLLGSKIGAFDVDDCIDETGELHPWATALVERCNSYCEVTPSGTGIRIIGIASGDKLHRKLSVADGVSVELYRGCERYITISGQSFTTEDERLANIDVVLDEVLAELSAAKQKKPKQKHDLDDLIKTGSADNFDGHRARAIWYVINELLRRGRSADEIVAILTDPHNGISAKVHEQSDPEAYARKQVEQAVEKQTDELLTLPAPSAPIKVARRFVDACCLHDDGTLTMHFWCGSWWIWKTTHWVEAMPHAVRSLLYAFTADAVYIDAEGEQKPWSPTAHKISDLADALSSVILLDADAVEQPCWLDHRETGPIVATSNGLLDVVSLKLYPHTPQYFGQVSVPFPYDTQRQPNRPSGSSFLASFGLTNRTPLRCSRNGLVT